MPLLLLVATFAFAGDADRPPDWWIGVPVQSVQIRSPYGGVPEESLDPLLRTRQGQPLDPGNVRLDLATLFRAGEFSSVEADVEPVPVQGEDGELEQGALVEYLVYPAPRIARVRVQGTSRLRVRDVLDAARLDVGDAFYPDVDAPRVARQVEEAYVRKGFQDVHVEVDPFESEGRKGRRELELWIRVDEGDPDTVGKLVFTGELPVHEKRLERVASKAGVEPGAPLSAQAVQDAAYAIRADLASPPHEILPFLHFRRGGWIEARVTPAISGDRAHGYQVTYAVESGRRLVLDVSGLSKLNVTNPPERKVREALGIDERLRLTRGFLEDADDRLVAWAQRRGWYQAKASVSLEPKGDLQVLHVDLDKGPKFYLLGRTGPGMVFEGNEAISDADLRTVMEEASDEVLRLHYVTTPEIAKGVAAARDLYVSHGYEDAKITLDQFQELPRVSIWRVPGLKQLGHALFDISPPVSVRLRFTVEEGALTRLASLAVDGAADGPDLGFVEDREKELVGQPFSPQALDQLAHRIVQAHRDAGWLEADARVTNDRAGDGTVSSRIVVDPGPRVLLRSFVIGGARVTSTEFLRRQVDLQLGEPLTAKDLDRVRHTLYDLGVFRTVTTEVIGDGVPRDLVVHLTERPRWAFELGGGLSTDQGIRAFGRVTRNDVWGLAHRWEIYGLVGLAYRSDSIADWWLDVRDPEWRLAATYTAPRWPAKSQQIVFDVLLNEQMQERTWRMARSGLGAALETKVGDDFTLRAGVRTEARRLLEVDPGVILPGEPWAALLTDGAADVPSPWREQHEVSLLALWDLRDDPIQTTKGVLLSLNGEWSPGIDVSKADQLPTVAFLKGEARFSGYVPVGPVTFHVSGEGAHGQVLGSGVLALEDRYRLGGTGTMRGFQRDAVGPRNEVAQVDLDWPDQLEPAIDQTVRADPTRWVSTGGDTRAYGTAEILVPLPVLGLRAYDGYAAALFTDVGNVWLLSSTATSELPQYRDVFDPALRYGLGVGLRVATPVGPLQIDVATNPAAAFATGEEKKLLQDEWEEPAVRGHLSLGTLF